MNTLIPYHITRYFERLCDICVRRYGSSANDVVIYVMNQNPSLEQYGIVLPQGVRILLPDLPVTAQTSVVRATQLPWV